MDSEEDSDIGGYDSSDDEDYVPEDCSGDDENEVIEEPKPKKSRSPTKRPTRKRRGIRLEDEESEESEEDVDELNDLEDEEEDKEDEDEEEEQQINKEEQQNKDKSKQRIENIWESFKTETKSIGDKEPDNEAKTEIESSVKKEETGTDKEVEDETAEDKEVKTNVQDEKKNHLSENATASSSGASKKRSAGLSGVLGAIGKKQKLSTLEKSKQDWDTFKKDQGIEDELRTSSKDGYLGKQEFLQRVDVRTWENERELRLATGRGKK